MKHRLFSRSIALLVVFGLLLTGSILPVSATTISEVVDSSNNLILDGDLIKDDNLIISDEIILRADDPSIAEESMILNYVDSAQFNAARHTQRLTDLEDLNTYVFANADGTRSVYMMHENVKYIDKNGVIKEKDISLINKAGGFGITQSNIELLIPTNPIHGIDFEYSGFAIKLTPQGLATAASAVQSDNSVVYDEAYGENTKLVYTPMLSGVKEDIVLTEYTDDATYTFVLETDGLNLYNGDNGYYLADSIKADPVFYLGEILIYDAVGKPDIGTMTVETISEGQEYLLTVIANDEFLSDPTTVYPVTVDPSITVSDSDTSGSIIDSPIFEGYPDRNFGTYVYNRVGTPSEAYGIGRTVVKLGGLTSSNEYQTITANQITNVTFYAKEASGGTTHYINLYPLTSNTTWTETSVTWNNIGSHTTSVNYGNTMYNGQWTAFDITNLVKAWKNGTYSANAGFIMTNENEANNKCFCSSEYSTSSSRPYVVMTYDTAISLNYTSASIVEGGTRTLVATTKPSGQTVTWATSNSSIATVSSSGVVTAKKAGTVTITASMVDADDITRTATCTVYVYIANGVYHIKNLNSNYYLHVKYGGIANLTDVYQYSKYSDSTSNNYKIRQMWKTYYLGNGRYSIRPLNKLDKGLDVTSSNVDIYNIGTSDTLDSVPSYGEWTISWYSTGYVFKNNGSDSKTMQIENASTSSGATVVASTYSTSTNCRWSLTKISSPPAGVYLYDTAKEAIVTTATRTVDVGTTKKLSTLQLSAVAYSGTNLSQNFTWSSSNTTVATVDSNGAVTGVSTGKATITGRVYRNSAYHYVSYTVNVSALLIYQTENTYYHDANGNYAEDLTCGDMTKDELRALDWVSWIDFTGYTPALHRADWEYMCTSLFSTGELQTVVLDMIDHFMDGTGSAYSNSVLTQKAYEHNSTQEYIKNVEEQLETLLNTYDGDISEFAYTANNRASNPLVIALKANNVYQPVYNTASDKINGLTICIDGLWGNKIEVTSYNISGNSYSYTLHYTLYDHFGLDQADVEKYGPLAGFRSWYVLQHYAAYDSAYKPFLTMIEFDVTVSGTIS